MRRFLIITLAFLVFYFAAATAQAQGPSIRGDWVGGFWFKTHWVRLSIRFDGQQSSVKGTANVIFSSYEGTNGAEVTAIRFEPPRLDFEIPITSGSISFNGKWSNDTIAGTFSYGGSRGAFGLTRIASVDPKSLARVYGLYRLALHRIIAIGQDFDGTGALRYLDFETGQTSALWPSSEDSYFSGGDGMRVNYPIRLRVQVTRERSGAPTKLVWKPVGAPASVASPVPLTEERLTWRNGDITIGGTLITPQAPGRHPVIIIVPGDYGSSRDFLRLYAYNFLRRGIAALIFDSRGAGASTGPANSSSFSDLANDVLAGVQLLRSKPNVNPRQVGLFGFSNSAFTTGLAASRSKDVAFLINQSMSGVPAWQQEIFRGGAMLRAEGFAEEQVRQAVDFMKLKFEVARTGEGWERLQAIRAKSGNERWFPFTNPGSSLERLRRQWTDALTYDPALAFDKITCPVLAVWGGKDRYIPVEKSAAIFEQAMKRAGNKDYTIKFVPRASHSMFDTNTGSTSESSQSKGYARGFLNPIADWLVKRVNVDRSRERKIVHANKIGFDVRSPQLVDIRFQSSGPINSRQCGHQTNRAGLY